MAIEVDTFEQWFSTPFEKTGEKVDLTEEEAVTLSSLTLTLTLNLTLTGENIDLTGEEVGCVQCAYP